MAEDERSDLTRALMSFRLWGFESEAPVIASRRLFSELLGTFLLVMAGAGGDMVDRLSHGVIGRSAAVTAPGLTVLAAILFMGAVSGAHLNPVVTLAFAGRGDFPWRRVPGYIVTQLVGAALAVLFLRGAIGDVGHLGATEPGAGISDHGAFLVEMALTVGLVSTILGTASRAQNVGPLSAIGVGAYIVLAGLWSSPISGASMNPARSFGPDLVRGNFADYWIYVAGPLAGAAIALLFAYTLRGPGGDDAALRAAQGTLARIKLAEAAEADREKKAQKPSEATGGASA